MPSSDRVAARNAMREGTPLPHFDSLISPEPLGDLASLHALPRRIDAPTYPFLLSRSLATRRFFFFLKKELNLCISHTTAVIALSLLLIFIIGFESTWRAPTTLKRSPSFQGGDLVIINNGDRLLQKHLHGQFSIPLQYLSLIPPHQKSALQHNLITHHATRSSRNPPRILFAHVHSCRLLQCLRAITSILSYARVTDRYALIFVDRIRNVAITSVLRTSHTGTLLHTAMIIDTDRDRAAALSDPSAPLNDWAHLTITRVDTDAGVYDPNVPIPELTRNRQWSKTLAPHTGTDGKFLSNAGSPPTLDNVAAVDTHVFLSLSEVTWSRYAPRSVQEALFEDELEAAPPLARSAVYSASLLGRQYHTRSLEQTTRKLEFRYKVPRLLLRGMNKFARKLLLLKLEAKRKKGVKYPRALIVHAQYGLGNRLRALGSAMAFTRRTERVLVLIWVPDQHLNCTYTDLFVSSDEFVVVDAFKPGEPWPFQKSNSTDIVMRSVRWYNYMRAKGGKRLPPKTPVVDEKGMHLYVSTCYVIQSPVVPNIIRTSSPYWHVLRSLPPNLKVLKLMERFASYPIASMIGIHIRGKKIETDISGINSTEYSAESSRTTDYWRNLTRVDSFVEEMQRQAADQLFYVAADDKQVFTRLEKEFPSRVFYTPRSCDSRGRECLPYALADMLLLAKCESLRGSYWSSFSELSTRIGGARFLLAGVDFGRPS